MRFSLVMHESLDFKKRASRWKTPRLRQLQASCGHPLWPLWNLLQKYLGPFSLRNNTSSCTPLWHGLSPPQSRTPGNGVSPTKSHTGEPQKTKTHTKLTRKMAAARSQKKNQLQDFYTKCLAKKKTITLRLERKNNNTKKLHEKKLGEKTSKCFNQANKIKISIWVKVTTTTRASREETRRKKKQ